MVGRDESAAFVSRVLPAAVFSAPGTPQVRCQGRAEIVFRYDVTDPWAVRMFFLHSPAVRWVVSRELFAAGLRAPSGQGGVRITPGRRRIRLLLVSQFGEAALFFHREDVHRFLAATEGVVPPGGESALVDWDAELAFLREVA